MLIDDPLILQERAKELCGQGTELLEDKGNLAGVWSDAGTAQGGLLNPKTNLKIPINLPFEEGVLERGLRVLHLGEILNTFIAPLKRFCV